MSFNLDGSYNRGWFQRDLTNQKLQFLTAQLAPAVLRHGGSGNDYMDYAVPTSSGLPTAPACLANKSYPVLPGTNHCPSWSDSKNCSAMAAAPGFCAAAAKGPQPYCCDQCGANWNATSYPWAHGGSEGCSHWSHFGGPATLTCTCLTQPKFDDLLELASRTNLSLVFGLSFSADANSSHTMALLQHVAESPHPVWGYEYGNEQHLVERTAQQFGTLQDLLPALYRDRPAAIPKLIGPDWFDTDPDGFFPKVKELGIELYAFTFHEYLGASLAESGSAAQLSQRLASGSLASLRAAGAPSSTKLWVGEAGGVAGGGVQGFTDAYNGGRWWLASLGVHALSGVSVFCRQDLLGGNYGLLSDNFPWNVPLSTTPEAMKAVSPLPDYWTALLWKRLMGTSVLRAIVDQSGTLNVMAFVHCSHQTPGGGLSVVLINTDTNRGVNMTFDDQTFRGRRVDYRLAAAGAHGIALNGERLEVSGEWGAWEMPSLDGRSAPTGADSRVEMQADSYSFFEFPEADAPACR